MIPCLALFKTVLQYYVSPRRDRLGRRAGVTCRAGSASTHMTIVFEKSPRGSLLAVVEGCRTSEILTQSR